MDYKLLNESLYLNSNMFKGMTVGEIFDEMVVMPLNESKIFQRKEFRNMDKDIKDTNYKNFKSLEKNGFDIILMKKNIKESGKRLSLKFRSVKLDNKTDLNKFQTLFDDEVSRITKDSIKENNKIKQMEKSKGDKYIDSILLLLVVVITNTLVISILATITVTGGSIIPVKIGFSLIAPLVEETAKRKSIKEGYSKEFAIVFNIYEFSYYVLTNAFNPLINVGRLILARTAVVIMHLTTTIIQKISYKFDLEHNIDEKFAGIIGYLMGLTIHGVWNFNGEKLDTLFNVTKTSPEFQF